MIIESLWIHLESLYRYSSYIYNHLTKSIRRGRYSLNCKRKWLSGETVSASSARWVSRWPYATRSECSRVCGIPFFVFPPFGFKTEQSWDLTCGLNLTAVTITLYFKWWEMGNWKITIMQRCQKLQLLQWPLEALRQFSCVPLLKSPTSTK